MATEPHWTFLSNHAHVLICIARSPAIRVRDIADLVGITERAVQRILSELAEAKVIERSRIGRNTQYSLMIDCSLRHPLESEHSVRELVELLAPTKSTT